MTERSEPLRGEVWDPAMPSVGSHPVVVLTISALLQRLSSTTTVLITGTPGPRSTRGRGTRRARPSSMSTPEERGREVQRLSAYLGVD
jgi:hypothetical protein